MGEDELVLASVGNMVGTPPGVSRLFTKGCLHVRYLKPNGNT